MYCGHRDIQEDIMLPLTSGDILRANKFQKFDHVESDPIFYRSKASTWNLDQDRLTCINFQSDYFLGGDCFHNRKNCLQKKQKLFSEAIVCLI
jgi:hypothetical protein